MIASLKSILAKSSAVYSPHHQDFDHPPQLPCKFCMVRPAPDVEIFDGIWRSLILCNTCQKDAEKSEEEEKILARRSIEALTRRAIVAGLTQRQIKRKVALRVSDWSKPEETRAEHNAALFYGPPGTGKTSQLAQLVKWAICRGWSAIYITEARLLEALKPSSTGPPRALDSWERYSLICLDELGSSKISEWARAQIVAFIDLRYASGKALALASNMDLDRLGAVFGDGLASRLHEMCGPSRIVRPDFDFRRQRRV